MSPEASKPAISSIETVHIENLEWSENEATQFLCLADFGAITISSGTLALSSGDAIKFDKDPELTTILVVLEGVLKLEKHDAISVCRDGQMAILKGDHTRTLLAIENTRAIFTHFGKRSVRN